MRLYFWLLGLLVFYLPFEHKYDKPFRFFSKALIPDGIALPKWFDYKLYFYPSDLLIPIFFVVAIFTFHSRKWILQSGCLLLMLICFTISIASSPLHHYPLLYLRLWQWITAILLFSILANSDREKSTKVTLLSLIASGTIQSLIAIAQYFHQGSLGLKILGEPTFYRGLSGCSSIRVPDGTRWIFDRLFSIHFDTTKVLRVMGTTDHPNVLGGLLAITSLATLHFFQNSKRKLLWSGILFIQLFALNLTYSRAAIGAFCVGAILWFFRANRKEITSACIMMTLIWGALFEQNFHRLAIPETVRPKLISVAYEMIKNKPIFGVGFQQFSLEASKREHIVGTHNIYLLMAAETGIPSLLCFLLFLWTIFQKIRFFNPTLLGMTTTLLLIGFFDFYPTQFQLGRLLLFLSLGLLASHCNNLKDHLQCSDYDKSLT